MVHATDAAGTEPVALSDGIPRRMSPVRRPQHLTSAYSCALLVSDEMVSCPPRAGADQLCVRAVDAVLQEPHRRHIHSSAVCSVHDPRVSSNSILFSAVWGPNTLPATRPAASSITDHQCSMAAMPVQVPDAVPGAIRRHQLDGVLPAAAVLHLALCDRAAQDGGESTSVVWS